MRKWLLLFVLLNCFSVFSQTDEQIIKSYFKTSAKNSSESQNLTDVVVNSSSPIGKSKAAVYYINQTYNGIPIENSTANVTIKDKQVVDALVNFEPNIVSKISRQAAFKNSSSIISNAVLVALKLKNYSNAKIGSIISISENQYSVYVEGYEDHPIYVDLFYSKQSNQTYNLVYHIELYDTSREKLYLVKVSAIDLNVIQDILLTLSCSQTNHNHKISYERATNTNLFKTNSFNKTTTSLATNASYLVYHSNLSGPLQGDRSIEVAPYDTQASPYGWHDVNGVTGADYTITRGNNVYAYEDKNGANEFGYSPDGGNKLEFLFPYGGPLVNPVAYIDASITNLFYVNNRLHDLFYKFGFDENSGNFQENQYGRLSSTYLNSSDPLLAESQDGSGQNNANISVPRDGSSPRMQMYLWKPKLPEAIQVKAPLDIQGYYFSADNVFEPGHVAIPTLPNKLEAKLVLVEHTEAGNLGCTPIVNTNILQGNIALIVRGTCSFSDKVLKAQQVGAIAVVVMNNVAEDNLISMAGEAPNVTIPALFVSKETGELWLKKINTSEDVILQIANVEDKRIMDASFDNSIVTHEFVHGVTTRLTGGRSTANCLNSTEQMGEGWSDFFSLLFQIKSGDLGTTPLGIGTYASGLSNPEEGIRTYPYSTDLSVNPLTYSYTNTCFYEDEGVTKVNEHKVGTVWASILWDLTWKLIDDYGFDSSFTDEATGNYKVFNLVMNALKLQPCNPSFITGRNAILKADELLYNGENSCLIWEVFAKRGVGLNASAGFNTDPNDIKDQVEDFTKPETCSNPENFVVNNPIIKVYPNPTTGDIIIDIPKYTSQINIEIFDIHGRLVYNDKLDNFSLITRLKTNNLLKGMYFIRIKGNKINYQTKIVKI